MTSRARDGTVLAGVLACAAVLRFADAIRRPLQVDEAYSLHLAALPLPQALHAVATLDVHPPLFLILLHALTSLHLPVAAVRLTMAALGVVSLWLFYWVVRSWHGGNCALIAAGLAAFMPSLIFYDTMVRMYAPFDAVAVATFLVLSVLYTNSSLRTTQRRILWCAWAVGCAALMWLMYLGFIVIAAQLLYACVLRRDGLARSLAGSGFALVAWLPQLPTFLGQLPKGGLAFPFYAQHQAAALFELPGQATIAVQLHGAGPIVAVASVVAWLWLLFAVALGVPSTTRSLATWMGAVAVLTLLYSFAGHKLLYADRYYLLGAYAACSLTVVALVRAAALHRNGAAIAGVAGGTILFVLGCAYSFNSHLYTADWPAVSSLVTTRSAPHDLIIMEQGSSFFPLERGSALDHHPLILVFQREQVRNVLRLAAPFSRIWVILFQAGPVDPDLSLVRELANTHQVIGAWQFVRWLPAESATVLLVHSEGNSAQSGKSQSHERH